MPPTNWLMTTPQVTPIRRREFIKTTVAATGAVAFPMVVPRRVFGANERLNIAAIGSGGKGQVDIDGCESQNIVALCDVDPGKAAHMFNRHAKAAKYADFRQMLEKEGKNIDAVTVSTPDHTHAPAAAMAMRLGKHVYAKTADALRLRGACTDGARPQAQGRHADGKPGALESRLTALR